MQEQEKEHAAHGHRDHGHDHGHTASEAHHHPHPSTATATDRSARMIFTVSIALNLGFVGAELAYGFMARSTALMADAGHNLSDALGLALAFAAVALGARKPKGQYTYGLRASSIVAALANGSLLMAACGAIAWEAVDRLMRPEPVASATVMIVAGIGILINGASALLLRKLGSDLNSRAAYLHMAADAAISLAVVVGAGVGQATGWAWIDPALSLAIVALIAKSSWTLMAGALRLSLGASPDGIDPGKVRAHLMERPGVADAHDVHVWAVSTTETAMTAHLVMPQGAPDDAFTRETAQGLASTFGIGHCTIQIERGDGFCACPLLDAPTELPTHHGHAHHGHAH